jgi:hypothetical protein
MKYTEEYVKQLEDALEKMRNKFEDVAKEVECYADTFNYDLDRLIPFQEGSIAYSLVYKSMSNSLPVSGAPHGIQQIGLSMETKKYTDANVSEDIITIGEVYDVLYSKQPKTTFDYLTKIKEIKQDHNTNLKAAEVHGKLYTQLLKHSNEVAMHTRRGAANIVITSPEVANTICNYHEFHDPPKIESGFRLSKRGTIGRFEIFVDIKNISNKTIVLYKSQDEKHFKHDGCGTILNNKGIRHWFRPPGYENYWEVIDIT